MRISAVIPTYNRRDYLPRAIDSALAQTVPVDEILIVDDGSTDGSAELVRSRYQNRVRVIRQANAGVAGARRRGIQEARGEWIAFLDSDDEWLPERNAELLRAAGRVPTDVAWIFGDLRIVTDRGEGPTLFEEYGLTISESPHVFADSLAVQWPFQFGMLQGSIFRREVLLELHCFTEGLQHSEDVLAGFQVACRYGVAAVSVVVGKYFRTSDLAASSAGLGGVLGADYFRARMLAFERAIQTGRRRPWNTNYAGAVRGYCQVSARSGTYLRNLAWQQFRHGGVSAKGLAFFCAAISGPWALRLWDRCAAFARRRLRVTGSIQTKENGLQAYLRSAGKSE
jgi:glycosyltransferase involved in cell wall biosynthesis